MFVQHLLGRCGETARDTIRRILLIKRILRRNHSFSHRSARSLHRRNYLIQTRSDDQSDDADWFGPRRSGRSVPKAPPLSGPNDPKSNANVASPIPLPPPITFNEPIPEPPESPRVASSLIGRRRTPDESETGARGEPRRGFGVVSSCQAAGERIEFGEMVGSSLGNSVTVAQLTLDQLVMVQIHVPQLEAPEQSGAFFFY